MSWRNCCKEASVAGTEYTWVRKRKIQVIAEDQIMPGLVVSLLRDKGSGGKSEDK